MPQPAILIVGAGPTGLNLALRLAREGTAFRMIDEHSGPAQESRAIAVQARTLEFYDQLGLADEIVAAGVKIEAVRLLENGRDAGRIPLGDFGQGLSPYPFILDFPQDEHERLLVEKLTQAGIEVERNTALKSFTQDDNGVDAVLVREGKEERFRCEYICGCDGARSAVRTGLKVGFGGGTYSHLYYVADVRLEHPDHAREFHLALGADSFALRLPARRGAMERLIGFAPDGIEHPTFDDVKQNAEALLNTKVAELNWFSTYRVHHRVAERFHIGRAFLLGDAGHLHSPVGGQGMNTGIGDAVNLSWKLAAVVGGRADAALLDSYEPERITFARELVATTDRLFRLVVSESWSGKLFRQFVLPTAVPLATNIASARRDLFRVDSQIAIHYPKSPLSSGRAGGVAGGDRLPWVARANNYKPLRSCDWQVHVYGEPELALSRFATEAGLSVERFAWSDDARRAGLAENAAYLVRPDAYIGMAAMRGHAKAMADYWANIGMKIAQPA